MDSFVGSLFISIGGPVAKYLLVMQGGLSSNPVSYIDYFSCLHPWEPRFKSGFHNSFGDYVLPDRIP